MSTPVLAGPIGFLQHRAGDLIKGRYEVLSHLGGGSFGSVYRVRDTAVGVDLACKEMHVLNHPDTPQDERVAALELFKREALNLATVRHPHIPSAYFEQEDDDWQVCPICGFTFSGAQFCPDHGAKLLTINQRFYLMMDFIDGPTLEEMAVNEMQATGRPLDETSVLEWSGQIAGALRALHRVGIVHRDVKPDNIKIRTEDNMAVLLDFGLTRKAEEAGGYGTFRLRGTGRMGTPGYAPPDLAEVSRPEARSDIYALGMMIYRLLTGRDPQEPASLTEMRVHPPHFFNAAISTSAEQLILRATQPDAAQRYPSVDDFLHDLHEIVVPVGRVMVAPFSFADGTRARTPLDLARRIETHPQEATNYLFNGLFSQWLLTAGYAAAAQAAEEVTTRYEKYPERALEIFRRAVYPPNAAKVFPELEVEPSNLDFGALASGARKILSLRIRNVEAGLAWGRIFSENEVASVTPDDANPFLAPLPGLIFPTEWEGNDTTIEIELDTSRITNGDYRGYFVVTMEGVTHELRVPVSYTVLPLQLRVVPDTIDLGTIPIGSHAEALVKVVPIEATDGQPRGTIYVNSHLGPLVIASRFEGDEPWPIRVESDRTDAVARRYEGSLQLDTNGGRLRVPLRYELVLPPFRLVWIIFSLALMTGIGAGLLRIGYGLINPSLTSRWIATGSIPSPDTIGYSTPVMLGALIGICYELFRLSRTDDPVSSIFQRPPQAHIGPAGWLFHPILQSILLSGVVGIVLCWPMLWIGHWLLWGLGDWLFYPLSQSLNGFWQTLSIPPDRTPPLMWALIGGLGGALWGVGRILIIRGHEWGRYAVFGVYTFAFLIMLINAMLTVGR